MSDDTKPRPEDEDTGIHPPDGLPSQAQPSRTDDSGANDIQWAGHAMVELFNLYVRHCGPISGRLALVADIAVGLPDTVQIRSALEGHELQAVIDRADEIADEALRRLR